MPSARLSDANPAAASSTDFRTRIGMGSVARHTLGMGMLMVTVFLWTASNFMASFIFSDNTYSKPFFIVYINTSIFAISLVPMILKFALTNGTRATCLAARNLLRGMYRDVRNKLARGGYEGGDGGEDGSTRKLLGGGEDDSYERRHRLWYGSGVDSSTFERFGDEPEEGSSHGSSLDVASSDVVGELETGIGAGRMALLPEEDDSLSDKLSLRATAWISLEFCVLWFLANYLAFACLEYTSVASATIFTSLSGIFTLVLCALARVESFSMCKLVGVLASLAGVALVSSVDLSGESDQNRGRFPHKTTSEIALGDIMALLSAVVYGAYVTVMKQRLGNEDRVNMPLFFGMVGLFNAVLLWPGLLLLHVTGLERFEMPASGYVWTIILVNASSSLLSDLTWAYAMLLTTPLVVTVGLSLTIPLSIIGEMFQYERYASGVYWIGAIVVVLSFLFVNNESQEAEGEEPPTSGRD